MNAPARLPATAQNSITVAMSERFGMLPEAFEATVRATCGMANATREEFAALILVAKEYGLNPILKEIYAYPKKGGGIVPVVSIDGWVNLINSQPQLDGIEFDIEHDDAKKLVAITCRIYRKDRRVPVSVTEYLAECKRPTDPWKMEHRMLRHKALIQCARYAFGFSNIHDEDEAQRIVEAVEKENGPPPAPPVEDIDMRRAKAAVIEHKPAAPVAPTPEQPASHVPRGQAQAVVADPAAAASNSDLVQRAWSEVLAEIQGHLDGARTIDDVSEIRALYADEEAMLSRSDREAFDYAFEQAENRVSKPVEPAEAPTATKEPASAETAQAGDVEEWAAYESRITRLAKATNDQAGADGLRKVWKAGKDYRALMEQREACTRQQRVALTAVVQEAIKRAEAPPTDPEPARLSAAPDITNTGSEAVRACGEEIFTALREATTREGAFKIWSRSASKRDECGASAEVLDAWAKEYREIRQRLPEEA